MKYHLHYLDKTHVLYGISLNIQAIGFNDMAHMPLKKEENNNNNIKKNRIENIGQIITSPSPLFIHIHPHTIYHTFYSFISMLGENTYNSLMPLK